MPEFKVISADSHVQEDPLLYRERVPKKFHDRVPHLEERDGARYYVMEGKKPRRLDIAAGASTSEDREREFRSDPSGGRNLDRRIEDMRRDGVDAEVIYANETLALYMSPDPEYQMCVARAFNDWSIELFGPHSDRFVPVAALPVSDIDAAVKEVERIARLGYRSVKIPITVTERPYNLPDYERLWAAAADTGLVLALHAFTNDRDLYPEDWGEMEGVGGALDFMVMRMADGMSPISLLISAGVPMRHPNLKFVVVECGAGWLAWLLYALDEQYDKKHMWIQPKLDLRPSEYFARQGYVTFGDDPSALRNLDMTGAANLMWGSDYPHDEGTFPHSRSVIERTFAGVSEADKHRIVYDNAAALYGFD